MYGTITGSRSSNRYGAAHESHPRNRPRLPGSAPSLARTTRRQLHLGKKFFTHPPRPRTNMRRPRTRRERHRNRVVLEPTRNAWAPVASWFRRRGATIALGPTTQSADLLLQTHQGRPPRLQTPRPAAAAPSGGSARAHRRRARRPAAQSSQDAIVKRCTAIYQRLDAQLELLGPAWYDALGSNYGKCALAILIRYADPTGFLRLGTARLTRFLVRHSRRA